MIYTITLNPTLNYDIYLDKFLQGNLNNAKSTSIRAGGKGINVSKVLNNLGKDSNSDGVYSRFFRQNYRKEIKTRGNLIERTIS